MKRALLVFLVLTVTKSYSQIDIIDIPETWEIDTWNGTNWNLLSQVTYTFNSKCLATEALGKVVDIGGSDMLENTTFLTIAYNTNDLPTESVNQLWNEGTNSWEDQLKTEFIYTENNLTEYINYDWVDNNWEVSNRELNTYNALNLITENIEQTRDETNTIWINVSKTEYTYNPNETFNVATTYSWNATNSNWDNDLRATYTYSGNVTTALKTDTWNGAIWENDRLKNYTYDSNGFLIETMETKWNGSTYKNDGRILRTNNNDGFPTEMITQTWFLGAWLNTSRDRRAYLDCNALSTEKISESEFKIHPNPAQGFITISTSKKASYTLSSARGQVLKNGILSSNSESINIRNLNSGLYFINIKTYAGTITKKIIKN